MARRFLMTVCSLLLVGTMAASGSRGGDLASGILDGYEAVADGDFEMALTRWTEAAREGNETAHVLLGLLYELGPTGLRDEAAAASLYMLSAREPIAGVRLGLLDLRAGELSQGYRRLLTMAERGDPVAQRIVGFCLEKGIGTRSRPARALRWYRVAAAAGDPFAMFNLGLIHESGDLVARDLRMALELYRSASSGGLGEADFALGLAYQRGVAGAIDYEAAFTAYSAGASSGSRGAQNNLGVLYELGLGRSKNLALARTWYLAGALQGLPEAQYNLGRMFELGLGASPDAVEAYKWYHVAATFGGSGRAALARDRVGVSLTDERLAEARQRAATWRVRYWSDRDYLLELRVHGYFQGGSQSLMPRAPLASSNPLVDPRMPWRSVAGHQLSMITSVPAWCFYTDPPPFGCPGHRPEINLVLRGQPRRGVPDFCFLADPTPPGCPGHVPHVIEDKDRFLAPLPEIPTYCFFVDPPPPECPGYQSSLNAPRRSSGRAWPSLCYVADPTPPFCFKFRDAENLQSDHRAQLTLDDDEARRERLHHEAAEWASKRTLIYLAGRVISRAASSALSILLGLETANEPSREEWMMHEARLRAIERNVDRRQGEATSWHRERYDRMVQEDEERKRHRAAAEERRRQEAEEDRRREEDRQFRNEIERAVPFPTHDHDPLLAERIASIA